MNTSEHDCGCNTNDKDLGTEAVNGTVTTATRYWAQCVKNWMGPYRSTYQEARADAKAHEAEKKHGTSVFSN